MKRRFYLPHELSRRDFIRATATAALGFGLTTKAAEPKPEFSFALLGDLHFDKLAHHDLRTLRDQKPDDYRQVLEYSRLTETLMPKLFNSLRQLTAGRAGKADGSLFVAHVGDLVEGLCMREDLAHRQSAEALAMLGQASLGIPFLFTKGNHDVTGPGAEAAYKEVFHPFLSKACAQLDTGAALNGSSFKVNCRNALFCFFDAYDRSSLDWVEAALAKRSEEHCFLVVHPPVVPCGARSTWHLYSATRDKSRREHLLELLGKHHAYALTGHIHKHNIIVRTTKGGGRFLQVGISSVIRTANPSPRTELKGVEAYSPDQLAVEPQFSPDSLEARRAVYTAEAPFVRNFEYSDMAGYAIVNIDKSKVRARFYRGTGNEVWRDLFLSDWLLG